MTINFSRKAVCAYGLGINLHAANYATTGPPGGTRLGPGRYIRSSTGPPFFPTQYAEINTQSMQHT